MNCSSAELTFMSNQLFSQALKLVPEHGWSKALLLSSRQLQLSDISTSLIRSSDLIKYHYDQELKNLANYKLVAGNASQSSQIREMLHFRLIQGNKNLTPANIGDAISLTLRSSPATSFDLITTISDEIWYKAGDQSTDTDWYTKRASLSGIYAACEAFQSKDTSLEFRDTSDFIDYLLSHMRTINTGKRLIEEWSSFTLKGWANAIGAQF